MEFVFWLLLCQTVVSAVNPVLKNDPNIIACPQNSIVKNSTISSPLYPEYHPNFFCEYHIQPPSDRYVVIKFEEFHFPNRRRARRGINYDKIFPRCEEDFLEISDDQDYVNKFRYCGKELKNKEFVSRKRAVKLILQTKTGSNSLRGFKASVMFPLRPTEDDNNDVTCSAAPARGYVRCTSPLKRVMTPESSIHLSVKNVGTSKCSKEVILTKEVTSITKKRNQVLNLDRLCSTEAEFLTVQHLLVSDRLIYDVSSQQQPHFEILLKEFSTKQIRNCGGLIKLKRDESHTILYEAKTEQKKHTCLWVIQAQDPEDNKIEIDFKQFTHEGSNNKCGKHHLSIMYIGSNMYELYQHELRKDPNKFKRTCNSGSKLIYHRTDPDIFGGLNLMLMLSHSDGFQKFEATATVRNS